MHAYELIGYQPEKNYKFFTIKDRISDVGYSIQNEVIQKLQKENFSVSCHQAHHRLLNIGGKIVSFVVCRHIPKDKWGGTRWMGESGPRIRLSDFVLIIRMDSSNEHPSRYYLAPSTKMPKINIRLPSVRGMVIDEFLYRTLDELCGDLIKLCAETTSSYEVPLI